MEYCQHENGLLLNREDDTVGGFAADAEIEQAELPGVISCSGAKAQRRFLYKQTTGELHSKVVKFCMTIKKDG